MLFTGMQYIPALCSPGAKNFLPYAGAASNKILLIYNIALFRYEVKLNKISPVLLSQTLNTEKSRSCRETAAGFCC